MMEMFYILIVVVRVTRVSALAVQEGEEERVWAEMDTFSLFHYVLGTEFKGRILIVLELRFSNLLNQPRARARAHTPL